jgi:hypothetical protein
MKNKINSILKKIKAEGFLRTGSRIKAALIPARTVWACRNILKGKKLVDQAQSFPKMEVFQFIK